MSTLSPSTARALTSEQTVFGPGMMMRADDLDVDEDLDDEDEDDEDEDGEQDVSSGTRQSSLSVPHSRYPRNPQPAVLAVVPHDGRFLLVQRANAPDAGLWGFPGGRLMLGESLAQGALRELAEETSVQAAVRQGPLPAAFASLDVIDRDGAGAVRYHFVLTALLCRWIAGEPTPGDDATACAWLSLDEIAAMDQNGELSAHVLDLARLALAIDQRLPQA